MQRSPQLQIFLPDVRPETMVEWQQHAHDGGVPEGCRLVKRRWTLEDCAPLPHRAACGHRGRCLTVLEQQLAHFRVAASDRPPERRFALPVLHQWRRLRREKDSTKLHATASGRIVQTTPTACVLSSVHVCSLCHEVPDRRHMMQEIHRPEIARERDVVSVDANVQDGENTTPQTTPHWITMLGLFSARMWSK